MLIFSAPETAEATLLTITANHPLRGVETAPQENPSFRNVKVMEVKGRYTVSGQARVSSGCFYYSVEDGHRVLLQETFMKVNKEAPNWTDFSIILPEMKGRSGKLFLNLYERDDGDGKIIHPYVITIP
ncbi:intracellular proteinase inhibitor [Bacillus sp. AFS015802]|nr:intracellular proteinase inhibitor [Bacillus sp. AFS015802]